jgi:hypothetical protein
MKITKSQLKKIIKEELEESLAAVTGLWRTSIPEMEIILRDMAEEVNNPEHEGRIDRAAAKMGRRVQSGEYGTSGPPPRVGEPGVQQFITSRDPFMRMMRDMGRLLEPHGERPALDVDAAVEKIKRGIKMGTYSQKTAPTRFY